MCEIQQDHVRVYTALDWIEKKISTEDGQEEQGREGVGANQGPDTLVAFVRNSRTPTNPFETADTTEVFVPKEIIARRIHTWESVENH